MNLGWQLCRGNHLFVGFLFSLLPTLCLAAITIQWDMFLSMESEVSFVADIAVTFLITNK